jgi:hypothetical protein
MISGEARDSQLGESYFDRLYHRFASVDSPGSQSLVVPAELTAPMHDAFSDLDIPISSVEGSVDFINVDGTTTKSFTQTTLEYQFPCDASDKESRFVRLRPVENVDAPHIAKAFDELRTIDANELTIHNKYTIQDIRFKVETNNPVEGTEHQIKIQLPVYTTPFLNRLLTHNPTEASKVAEICDEREPDAVVTPFVAHANKIQQQLAEQGIDQVPVCLPEELTGEQFGTTIVSLGVADEDRMVTPPINRVEILYMLLNSGVEVFLVGDRQTLERNSILKELI